MPLISHKCGLFAARKISQFLQLILASLIANLRLIFGYLLASYTRSTDRKTPYFFFFVCSQPAKGQNDKLNRTPPHTAATPSITMGAMDLDYAAAVATLNAAMSDPFIGQTTVRPDLSNN